MESGLCQTDLEVVLGGSNLPATLHLPKVRDRQQLEEVWRTAERLLGTARATLGLILFIETAGSLLRVDEICSAAWALAASSPVLCPVALVFGSDDFAADIGATRSKASTELMLARQLVVTAAKAHKLQAIDAVYIDYKDQAGLAAQCEEGAAWGFTGKQVIHPGQVETVQAAFTPSLARLDWANSLMEAFKQNQQEGRGAFTFRGQMIDMPTVMQAQNVLDIYAKSA